MRVLNLLPRYLLVLGFVIQPTEVYFSAYAMPRVLGVPDELCINERLTSRKANLVVVLCGNALRDQELPIREVALFIGTLVSTFPRSGIRSPGTKN